MSRAAPRRHGRDVLLFLAEDPVPETEPSTPLARLGSGLAFPHAAQAIQITRRRKVKGKGSRETCYAATSLTVTQADPARLAAIIRGHWGIEGWLH